MVRHWYVLGACILAGVVVILLSGRGQAIDPEEIAAAQKKVLEMADDVAAKKNEDAEKKAAEYVKKNVKDYKELEPAMKIMALRDNGGFGYGAKGKFSPDGIEAKLINLGRKQLNDKQMGDEAEALAKSANIIIAVSDMALITPVKKVGGKNPEDFKKWAQDMKDAATQLSDAVAKKDAKAIKDASEKLNTSCTDCHNKFKNK
jgi:hypothetical protein